MLQGFGSLFGAACLSAIPVWAGRIPATTRLVGQVPPDYEITPMQWSGSIKQGGEVLSFNGTVQEVEAQIRALDPDFVLGRVAKPRRNLQKKAKEIRANIVCDVGGDGAAGAYPIYLGQTYLDSLNGSCGVPSGPRVCARISCSYGGGIWLCNDNPRPLHPKCSYLATYVGDLLDQCSTDGPEQPWGYGHVQGQEFDTDNYNIIVGRASC